MSFVADLHVHSHFSRATAKNCDLPHLELWARRKGVALVGTGDFTHPGWIEEITNDLIAEDSGFFRLKPSRVIEPNDGLPAPDGRVRFVLTAEISSIYKKGDKTRKVHSLILMPDLEAVERFNDRLSRIGNLTSDGRPILGLAAKDLLQITLETHPEAMYIPAHAWTPWFSVLGSKGGFDSMEECFEDLTPHIHAIETGLSSDPPMNWRVSALDRFTLISNSDAHSPGKLAREANLLDVDMTFQAVTGAIKTGHGFEGTIEFFPEEGKYHLDGHRKCGLRLEPAEADALAGRCPKCGRPLTLGVQHRVEDLADREPGFVPEGAPPFHRLLSLHEILGQVFQCGPGTKRVAAQYGKLLERLGPELDILLRLPPSIIAAAGGETGPLLARAVDNMRQGKVQTLAGFDGQFGTIIVLDDEDRRQISGQEQMWAFGAPSKPKSPVTKTTRTKRRRPQAPPPSANDDRSPAEPDQDPSPDDVLSGLDPGQCRAVTAPPGPLIVTAGPGTGKTLTLSRRAAFLVKNHGVRPEQIAAITFTRQAAGELKQRIERLLAGFQETTAVTASTFHALGAEILRLAGREFSVMDEEARDEKLRQAARQVKLGPRDLGRRISDLKQNLLRPQDVDPTLGPDLARGYELYQSYLEKVLDFDDLIVEPIFALEADPDLLARCREKWPHLLIDEFQDLCAAQWRLARLLAPGHSPSLTVIGDPRQAIYGFRGASPRFFDVFRDEMPGVTSIELDTSYRCPAVVLAASRQVIVSGDDPTCPELASLAVGRENITLAALPTDKAEAVYVSRKIEQILGGASFFHLDSGQDDFEVEAADLGLSDMAVLFRTHAQAAALQEALDRSGIPYQTAADMDLGATDELDFTAEKVSLLTLHAAKGLEFACVFITGCEDDLIPFNPPFMEAAPVEEERRLFYVGLTRARRFLCLTHAARRPIRGKITDRRPSPFLADIEQKMLESDDTRLKRPAARQLNMF
jgi:DNA helicase-2/ATP-dependent DNA helicase PcrA